MPPTLAGTDLYTDPTSAAAGHLDLLTTVSHELGHVIGLDDSTSSADAGDLMYINLVDGERRLPDATDVAKAVPMSCAANLRRRQSRKRHDRRRQRRRHPVRRCRRGHLRVRQCQQRDVPPPVTHVMDYHYAEGDRFDFSALTSQFHSTSIDDHLIVRAMEDASGTFATLQVDKMIPGMHRTGWTLRRSPARMPAMPSMCWSTAIRPSTLRKSTSTCWHSSRPTCPVLTHNCAMRAPPRFKSTASSR